jgi:D-sedoheptulose 7-phosphate isomerase/D-glycero-D-manno-heptose 1,7-bisphosphate phosphatase
MKHHAIFLDRDGTINHNSGYVKDPSQIILLPGVSEGIKKLKDEFGFKAIVISNQAGVSKGIMTSGDVESVNDRINELLKNEGTGIDAFFYCPFHPDLDPPEKSNCRKPSPFMIVQAAEEHGIDLSKSYMIGDKASDVESGINAGVKTVLINSEDNRNEISILHNLGKKPNFTAANFKEVCDFIINDFSGGI